MSAKWSPIVALWLCGVLAAAQLSKVSTLAPLLRTEFNLSLGRTGFLVSLLEVGGAAFGLAAGLLLPRIGSRVFLLGGLAGLGTSGLLFAAAPDTAVLFAARGFEGVAYACVVIAAPTMIVAVTTTTTRSSALTLWSTFVPVGVATGGLLTAALLPMTGVRAGLAAWSLAPAIGIIALSRLDLAATPSQRRDWAWPASPAWAATAGFGCYTAAVCALTGLLPLFLVEQRAMSVGAAGFIAAMAGLGALPAALTLLFLMRRRIIDPTRSISITLPSILVAAVLAVLVFSPLSAFGRPSVGLMSFGAVAAAAVTRPLVFTRLPDLAGSTEVTDPRVASANGLLTQFGAAGALIGPPLGGAIVQLWGWQGLGAFIAACLLGLLGLQWLAARLHDRSATGNL